MRNIPLYSDENHKFILLNENQSSEEGGVNSNQYLIVHNEQGILLDPGGWGVMPRVLTEMLRHIQPENLNSIILSHQDPDIVGGLATWLELTSPKVYVAKTWLRFLPHYGKLDVSRFVGVADEGMEVEPIPGYRIQIIPAHFLHSPGQINTYDPISKIVFTGDIGAATYNSEEPFVDDFNKHIPNIENFHQRYMASNRALRIWCENIRKLDIDMIAPQHGPIYRGQAIEDLLNWLEHLLCGIDLLKLESEA